MYRLLPLVLGIVCAAVAVDPLDYVNLFIGTVNGGHTFPGHFVSQTAQVVAEAESVGATVPHGMVKVGMDTDSPGNVCLSIYLISIMRTNYSNAHSMQVTTGIPSTTSLDSPNYTKQEQVA